MAELSVYSFAAYAHDVRHFVLVQEQLLLRLSEGPNAELVERLSRNVTQLDLLTRAVLLVQSGKFQKEKFISPLELDINDLCRESVESLDPLFRGTSISIELRFDSTLPNIIVDPALMLAALQNLIENALKYSEGNTSIVVNTERVADSVIIRVINTGFEIPQDELESIFLEGYRGTNTEHLAGSGLGLFIVRRVIEAHGGKVAAQNHSESRVSFEISLPLNGK